MVCVCIVCIWFLIPYLHSYVAECSTGVVTIRAFQRCDWVIRELTRRLDNNTRHYFYSFAVNRWLGVRLEILGNLVVVGAGLIGVLLNGSISAGMAGLAISSSLQLCGGLNWMIRQISEAEVQMNAVERIEEYAAVPAEGAAAAARMRTAPPTLPPRWPQRGQIRFKHLSVRYGEDPSIPPALRDIDAIIAGGQKVGICGRTGAGKSTIVLALFRLVEAASGTIEIDGVDIGQLPLRTLRSRLAIVPQEPTVWRASVRDNVDPLHARGEAAVWAALEQVGLAAHVRSLPGGVHAQLDEDGDSLSVGQRQMLSLARAVLRDTAIVVMDEATSGLDFEADEKIRVMLRQAFFQSKTVLTVAHRLNTIADSDTIMCFARGQLVECDAPQRLLRAPDGLYASLVRDSDESFQANAHTNHTAAAH